jgi:hypothetical protein
MPTPRSPRSAGSTDAERKEVVVDLSNLLGGLTAGGGAVDPGKLIAGVQGGGAGTEGDIGDSLGGLLGGVLGGGR